MHDDNGSARAARTLDGVLGICAAMRRGSAIPERSDTTDEAAAGGVEAGSEHLENGAANGGPDAEGAQLADTRVRVGLIEESPPEAPVEADLGEGLGAREQELLGDLFAVISEHADDAVQPVDRERVAKAFRFACERHADQQRKSGEEFITHPVGVAKICAGMRLDTETICAALLHDTVEDTSASLEDVAFSTLHPRKYSEIKALVSQQRTERESYVERAGGYLVQELEAVGIKADVSGRAKHFYSIYAKMTKKGREFNEIYDLTAMRVIVETVKDCYGTVGVIHSLWKPLPGRFKDFIAMPKFNMYQSLHTTVIGPEGRPLEIQIRTQPMNRTAEYGIAAHWRYKDKGGTKRAADEKAELAWLGRVMEWQQEMADPREFMEGLKIDLYEGQVFVFTPKGDVMNLPAGATPIDFAYAIHTEVGHRCMGARVGDRLVPLGYELKTGDTVEILTSKAPDAGRSRDWLGIVKSPRARNKIRQWFSRERREDALETGRDQLARTLRKHSLPVVRLTSDQLMRQVAADLHYPTLDALYVAIGEGQVSPQSVVSRLTRLVSEDAIDEAEEIPAARPVRLGREPTQAVVVQGRSDVWVKLA